MFKKVKKTIYKDPHTIDPKNSYDMYKVAVVIDGVVEAFMEVNLGNFCALMSTPTFLDAGLNKYNIGDKV
jgi:hypothetical protein